jgi:diadenosine tetraphosphate (Ap4A) HIT family hydrolase
MTADGWPQDWDDRKAGRDCPMCTSIGRGDDDRTVTIAELGHTEVRLERRSRLPGYCIVVWRHGHVAEPFQLPPEAIAGYWSDVTAVAHVLDRLYQPLKLNLLTLGNWVPHLHTHVIPRYHDDPAPGGPIAWDAIFTESPTDPAVLERQAAAIREALRDGGE